MSNVNNILNQQHILQKMFKNCIEKSNKKEIFTTNQYLSKDPKDLSQFFKEEGNKYYLQKEYDIALIYFNKAIEHEPDNKIYYSNRAACYLAKGSYRLALRDALKCI